MDLEFDVNREPNAATPCTLSPSDAGREHITGLTCTNSILQIKDNKNIAISLLHVEVIRSSNHLVNWLHEAKNALLREKKSVIKK